MFNPAIPFPRISWLPEPLQLRIDVSLNPSTLENELDNLRDRLHLPGDALHGLPCVDIKQAPPGLIFHYREADGEHYIYAEDRMRRRLAGYTVFNRLVEVDRRADRILRAPHSKYAPAYQRCGIATAIYRWWLDAGRNLISGARQSPGANALWHSLSEHYALVYIDLRDKTMRHLGSRVDSRILQDLHTRMILLGKGWDIDRLAQQAGMLPFPIAAD